jgi:Ribonuclease HI
VIIITNEDVRYYLIDENSPAERIMNKALKARGINYKEQYSVYEAKSEAPKYIIDFLVEYNGLKVVVECDGASYHEKNQKQREHDKLRDYWLLAHGFNAVLRFSYKKIKYKTKNCIAEIKQCIDTLEKGMKYKQSNEMIIKQRENVATEFDISKKTVVIYCSGVSNSRIWGQGAATVILKYKDIEKTYSKAYHNTNANRMRIISVILGLQLLKFKCNVEIHIDDQILVGYGNRLSQVNKSEHLNMRNYDLWIEFRKLVKEHNVIFKYCSPKGNCFIRNVKSLSRKIAFDKNAEKTRDMEDSLAPPSFTELLE